MLETGRMETESRNMGQIRITVDWNGRNYAACPENEDIACIATGKTLGELKSNMEEALEMHAAGLEEDSLPIPPELQGKISPVYAMTSRALLHHSENWITLKALSLETGINQQQLSHYANGWRNPRPAMQKKIADGIRSIGKKLCAL